MTNHEGAHHEQESSIIHNIQRSHIAHCVILSINLRRSNSPFDEPSLWLVFIHMPMAIAYRTIAQLVKSFSSLTLTASDDTATVFMSIINKYV